MAEEDIIFGKNRHFFGGIEPSNMKMFKYLYDSSNVCGVINMVLPDDTVVDGQTLCTVAGVVIRASLDHYPTNEFDGDLLTDIKAVGGSHKTIYDYGQIDGNNDLYFYKYFAAFPYTTQGVYNRSTVNRCSDFDSTGYYYGFDIDLDDSNPSTRVSYPTDVDNYGWNPVSVSDDGTFNAGSWANALVAGQDFTPIPCLLYPSGDVMEYLDSSDYSKTISGESSSISDTSLGTNAMMEWPKIYTKRWETTDGVYHFRCSNVKIDDDWECWCNYDENGNEIDHFYTAIYNGAKDSSSALRSMKGSSPSSTTYTTNDALLTAIEKNGTGWSAEHNCDRMLIQDLLVMIGSSTDCQSVFGDGGYDSYSTGYADALGLFGSWTDGNRPGVLVKVFGMEGWYTTGISGYCYIDGIRGGKERIEVKPTAGSDYTYISTPSLTDTGEGYISEMKTMPFGRFPEAWAGSSSTYEADKIVFTSAATVRDGYSRMEGPFGVTFANVTTIRANLSYKPLAK